MLISDYNIEAKFIERAESYNDDDRCLIYEQHRYIKLCENKQLTKGGSNRKLKVEEEIWICELFLQSEYSDKCHAVAFIKKEKNGKQMACFPDTDEHNTNAHDKDKKHSH